MAFKNIRDYIFNKLIFPKVLIVDKPGIIINKSISKFGKEKARTRVVYHFEDIAVNLYLESIKKLGREKTDDLWYKIGKDGATRYLFSLRKKIIQEKLSKLILDQVFNTICGTGMTFAERFNYNLKEKSFTSEGRNCIICNKTKSSAFMAGIVSGILSSILKKNIEAESRCIDCPNKCKIIANLDIPKKYIPDMSDLIPDENYDSLNFPKNLNGSQDNKSFTDLLRFKVIRLNPQNNVFYFKDQVIVPSEIDVSNFSFKNYFKSGEEELFKSTVIKTSESIAKKILKDENNIKEKINFLKNMISAFGWGIAHFKGIDRKIIVYFEYPPVSRYGSLFHTYVINGYLNSVYNKKLKIEESTPSRIIFSY